MWVNGYKNVSEQSKRWWWSKLDWMTEDSVKTQKKEEQEEEEEEEGEEDEEEEEKEDEKP